MNTIDKLPSLRMFCIIMELEEADDGDTTHYGGYYEISELLELEELVDFKDMTKVDSECKSFSNFKGNDRSNSPSECVLHKLYEDYSVEYCESAHNALEGFLSEIISQEPGKTFLVVLDGENVSIEPMG